MKAINFKSVSFAIALAVVVFLSSCEKEEGLFLDKKEPGSLKSQTTSIVSVNTSYSVDLMAGQHILAGNVTVSNDGQNFIITFNTHADWKLYELHLWLGKDLSDLPKNRGGNPIIGHFPYKVSSLNGVTEYSFVLPMSDFGSPADLNGKMFYVAAHAVVTKDGTNQTETAWAGIDRINNRGSWATYFSFVFVLENTNPPTLGNETAYAFGNTTFIDAGLTNARWGWIIDVNSFGNFSAPIYAGAGQNNINNATHVGTLNYSYDGETLNVEFQMFNGFGMNATHLYASTDYPTTIANGLFGNQNSLNAAESDTYSLKINGGSSTLYIIAHAEVMGL